MRLAHTSPHSSDSEDSAPEVLTLSSTKRASRTQSDAVHVFETAQKAKRKRANRERDAALKEAKRAREQAEEGSKQNLDRKKSKRGVREKGKEPGLKLGVEEMTNAEERMERAMREAAEESDSGVDSAEDDVEEWQGIDTSNMDAEEVTAFAAAKHLPDHLFSAAAAAAAAVSHPTSSSTPPPPAFSNRRRKDKKSKAKELIVGTRTIRTLPSAHPDALTASLTLPPARINRFLKRTLHLKQSRPSDVVSKQEQAPKKGTKAKRWERRPVNIGVLRSIGGPAMRFARGAAV